MFHHQPSHEEDVISLSIYAANMLLTGTDTKWLQLKCNIRYVYTLQPNLYIMFGHSCDIMSIQVTASHI